ncbi:hypothetical protein EIN_378390 [Entamoeba invadens IP1]|uniref:Uncharacterized protein n=1 Tax=Entamoeba invadens IP1 TaxID=370355 RepID=A0A0A1TUB3_ENTIV|nr:hypothetical protein EIN_378390 [Entamoeba invadens IP1]ELP83534.1 hypothetical protein EIN_378390 [Entamoeba invadens IP1]|eukprot:XP_004182880.1 hypothetical protein EIN_378390 [Entamoeba invadens IP1]
MTIILGLLFGGIFAVGFGTEAECTQKITVRVLPYPFTKPQTLPHHPCIDFQQIPVTNDYTILHRVQLAYRNGIIAYGFQNTTLSVKQYEEDMVMSQWLYANMKKIEGAETDIIMIAPPRQMTDDEVNTLYEVVQKKTNNFVETLFGDDCFIQLYLQRSQREKLTITNDRLMPFWPDESYRAMPGMLFSKKMIEYVNEFAWSTWYVNRHDVLFQHFCEVVQKPIYVSPINIFGTVPLL